MKILIAGLFIFISAAAQAQQYNIAPPPTGSDSNNCVSAPCATVQKAVEMCPMGGYCVISVAAGTYSQQVVALYYKVINIFGPLNSSGQCINRSSVTFSDGFGSGTIFSFQDHVILTVSCMTVTASNNGSIGFSARQFAIGDINDVSFGNFPNSYAIVANETSKVNVMNPTTNGTSSRWAAVADNSTLTVGGVFTYAGGSYGVAMVSVLFGGILNFNISSTSGTYSGYAYQCVDAIIKGASAIPATSGAFPGSTACRLY